MPKLTTAQTVAVLEIRLRQLEQKLAHVEFDRHTAHARIRALEAVLGGMLRNAGEAKQTEAIQQALETLRRIGGPPVAVDREDEVVDLSDALVTWICTGQPPD